MKNKKGQEEMVGFVLIVVLVSVILLILVAFMLLKTNETSVESYEAESFLQALLQHTTNCENVYEEMSIRETIFSCINNQECINEKDSCKILEETIKNLIETSWSTKERPIKGFFLEILSGDTKITLQDGNFTGNSRTASQYLTRAGNEIEIKFSIYG
jgi:cell division protein FtsX